MASLPVVNCGDCGAVMVLTVAPDSDPRPGRPLYLCSMHPSCRGSHGAHPDGQPMGVPAPRRTNFERARLHSIFDELWKEGLFESRSDAYAWLAGVLRITPDEAHIAMFDGRRCRFVQKLVVVFRAGLTTESCPLVDLDPAGLAPAGVDVDDFLDDPPPTPRPAPPPRPPPAKKKAPPKKAAAKKAPAKGKRGAAVPEVEVPPLPPMWPCLRCFGSGEVVMPGGLGGGYDVIEVESCDCPAGRAAVLGTEADDEAPLPEPEPPAVPLGSSTAEPVAYEPPDGW